MIRGRGGNPHMKQPAMTPQQPAQPQQMSADDAIKVAKQYEEDGKIDTAEQIFQQLLQQLPNTGYVHNSYGLFKARQNDLDTGLSELTLAVEKEPENNDFRRNLGILLRDTGKLKEAIKVFEEAIKTDPKDPDNYFLIAEVFLKIGLKGKALQAYEHCLVNEPKDKKLRVVALCNLAAQYIDFHQWDKAIDTCKQGLALEPENIPFKRNLAWTYKAMGDTKQSIIEYKKLLEAHPGQVEARRLLLDTFAKDCDWSEWDETLAQITDEINEIRAEPCFQFHILSLPFTYEQRFKQVKGTAKAMEDKYEPLKRTVNYVHTPKVKDRIKVAYVSSDFRDHPVAHLTHQLYGLHDRDKFEVYAYSYGGKTESSYEQQIANDCDHFVDISQDAFTRSADRIYEDGIDILVDLMGYTHNSRLEVDVLRPAPIQVNYLGFPGTFGGSFMDYIIVDEMIVPRDKAMYFTEELVYMPNAYMITDDLQPISEKPLSRADFNLPEDKFVFVCFNNCNKIDPTIFNTWMDILQAVPDSVLWLKAFVPVQVENLQQEAQKRGIDPQRLIFAERIDKAEHLARHRLADLYLDTTAMNGHTTVSDCLWAGLPVLTVLGSTFPSRVASSLLTQMAMPELIVDDLQAYKEKAIALANDRELLQEYTDRVRENRKISPLFDTTAFVRDLERAYQMMWKQYCEGKAPEQIDVKKSSM